MEGEGVVEEVEALLNQFFSWSANRPSLPSWIRLQMLGIVILFCKLLLVLAEICPLMEKYPLAKSYSQIFLILGKPRRREKSIMVNTHVGK